jgi:peptide deformylase
MTSHILTVPHTLLRKKSISIARLTPEIQAQVTDLVDTLRSARDPEGVGLSFPQIGLSLRGFVTYLEHRIKVYLNPVILDVSDETTLGGLPERPTLEGCLSIPHYYGPVPRAKRIKIQALDEHGVEFTKILTSFPARLALHEYDHLEGILFTDYTIRESLPLYYLDRQADKFIEVKNIADIIQW